MALDASKLKDGLMETSRAMPKSPAEAAQKFAQSYARYAVDAQSVLGGSPVSLTAAQFLLEESMVAVFSAKDPVTAAQAKTAALIAFWLLPPIVFTGATPGVVTLTPGAALLPSALVATWAANVATKTDHDQAIGRIADALDLFTRTVVVAHPPPSAGVGPIT